MPAAALDEVIDDCIAAHVRGAVVVTSVDGTDVDVAGMVVRARNNGMRIIGPSSMGAAASSRVIGLDASLLPERLSEGRVAISMQSGSLGASFLHLVKQQALGLSWFVSLGDRADVSGTDLLQFFEDDESTRVIGMYTEDLGDPRRFARIARRVSKHRPIVAVRTSADLGPTNSALYRHCGLIEVPTVAALLDTVRVLATQPVLRGDRIAVLSNYPSPERLARRAITARGLRTVEPPIPLDFRATPTDYTKAIEAALHSEDIDGLMVVYAPPLAEAVGGPVAEIERASAGADKPITAVLLATADGPITPGSNVPNFMFPEPAAAVLGRSWAYGRWLASEAASPPATVEGVDVDRVSDLVAAALRAGTRRPDPAATADLLTAYGIRVPPTRFVAAADAVDAANEVGFPVAIKARHRQVGRSLRAGVALDVADANDVQASIEVMRTELGDDADFVIVQAMAPPGLDLRIHARVDDEGGAVVSVGIGGIQAGLVGDDEPVRLAPLSIYGADSLVAESRVGPALAQAGIEPECRRRHPDPGGPARRRARRDHLARPQPGDHNPHRVLRHRCDRDRGATRSPRRCAAPAVSLRLGCSRQQVLADPVEELAAQAERIDVDALVVAVESLPERLERHAWREQRGAIGNGAALAIEPGVGAAHDQPGHEVGVRIGVAGPAPDDIPQLVVRRRACRLGVLQHADVNPAGKLPERVGDVLTGRVDRVAGYGADVDFDVDDVGNRVRLLAAMDDIRRDRRVRAGVGKSSAGGTERRDRRIDAARVGELLGDGGGHVQAGDVRLPQIPEAWLGPELRQAADDLGSGDEGVVAAEWHRSMTGRTGDAQTHPGEALLRHVDGDPPASVAGDLRPPAELGEDEVGTGGVPMVLEHVLGAESATGLLVGDTEVDQRAARAESFERPGGGRPRPSPPSC